MIIRMVEATNRPMRTQTYMIHIRAKRLAAFRVTIQWMRPRTTQTYIPGTGCSLRMGKHRALVSRKMGKFISFPLSIFHHFNIFGIDAGSANIVWLGEERTYGAFSRRHDNACLCTLEKSGSEVTLGVQNIMDYIGKHEVVQGRRKELA